MGNDGSSPHRGRGNFSQQAYDQSYGHQPPNWQANSQPTKNFQDYSQSPNRQYPPYSKNVQNVNQPQNITKYPYINNENPYRKSPPEPNNRNFIQQNGYPNDFRINVVNLDNKSDKPLPPIELDLNNSNQPQKINQNRDFKIFPNNYSQPFDYPNKNQKNFSQHPPYNNNYSNPMNIPNLPPNMLPNPMYNRPGQQNKSPTFNQINETYPQLPANVIVQDYGKPPPNIIPQNPNHPFAQDYRKPLPNILPQDLNHPSEQMPNLLNPEYSREEYRKKNVFIHQPNTQTSLEKRIKNNSMFAEESYLKDKKIDDPRNTTLDYLLANKTTEKKIQEQDLMDKSPKTFNEDYNNVFLNGDGVPPAFQNQTQKPPIDNFSKMNMIPNVPSNNIQFKKIVYKNEGFDKLEECSNLFMKMKFMSIHKDEKACEDAPNFFVFPGTPQFNSFDINPLFYILFNNDFKSKYCYCSSCRNVFAQVLHAKGLYKGHEFLEICEDDASCCSDQVFIYYMEEGHKIKIGKIELQNSCVGDSFLIFNDKEQPIYKITQNSANCLKLVCKCQCEDCQSIDFQILSNSDQQLLSKFEKKRNTCCCLSTANEFDEFKLNFPETSNKIEKALLLAAFIYLQKKYFEG